MYIAITCLTLCLVGSIYCKDMMYVGYNYPSSFYNCFRQAGNDQIILALDMDFEDQSVVNFVNAKNAGLKVDLLYGVCRSQSFDQLGQQIIKFLGQNTIQNLWLFADLDQSDPQCYWLNHSSQQNCQYFKQFMQGLKKYNIKAGAFIYQEQWTLLFGSVSACPELSKFLAWWFPIEVEQDFQPNFNNYKQIGGWTKPFMKLYRYHRQICGNDDVLTNYYE